MQQKRRVLTGDRGIASLWRNLLLACLGMERGRCRGSTNVIEIRVQVAPVLGGSDGLAPLSQRCNVARNRLVAESVPAWVKSSVMVSGC